jgi:putative endonuclease
MQTRSVSRFELARLGVERWALLRLGSLAGKRKPRPAHLLTGERGELEALFYLRRQGYIVVERRWRSKEFNGDLDLIAWDGATLCFVEVKARTRRDLTPAASAINEAKKQRLRRMAGSYRRTLPAERRYSAPVRFDVVSIYLLDGRAECELVRDAFAAQEPHLSRFGV